MKAGCRSACAARHGAWSAAAPLTRCGCSRTPRTLRTDASSLLAVSSSSDVRRTMETKPVITCLKTLLIVYSFVFWVRVLQWSRRCLCVRVLNSRNRRFFCCFFFLRAWWRGGRWQHHRPTHAVEKYGDDKRSHSLNVAACGVWDGNLIGGCFETRVKVKQTHILAAGRFCVCARARVCSRARTIASWLLSFSRLKDASHCFRFYPTTGHSCGTGPHFRTILRQ